MSNKNKLSRDPSKNTAKGNDHPEMESASNLIKNPPDFDLGLSMTGSIRKEDIERILSIQNKSIKNFARTNELLGKFNDFSSSKYDVLQHMFLQHTRLLVDLKKDLTNVFLRIRRLKVRLQMQYPDAFEATFNLRKDLEDRLEQEEAGEPTYGDIKERTKKKKGKTKAKNDNKEDKGVSKTQTKTSELVDSKNVGGSDCLSLESENPEVADNQVQIQNTALLNNSDTISDSKADTECGKIPKTKSIKMDLCAMDKTQFSTNTETLVRNDLPVCECEERDGSETPCGSSNDFCTDVEVNKDSSDCPCEIEDNEEELKKGTEDKKDLQGTDNEADQQNANDNFFTQVEDCNKTSNVDNRDTHVIERDPEGTAEISNDTGDYGNVKDDS